VRILIAMPVYNELKYVRDVIEKVRRFHSELLVVDDGSTDGTGELLRKTRGISVLQHVENRGYGQSLIDAFAWADARGYEWVITMYCDEQHEPEMIPEFIRYIQSDQWDLISGSRYLRPDESDDLPPLDRRSINVEITSIVNDLFGLKLTDAFCGFKAHRVSANRRMQLDVPGYAFPMQLWPQAWAASLRITEIPVRLIYNDPTRHFGGMLDDASNRLQHYLKVLAEETERAIRIKAGEVESGCCCSCSGE